MRQGIETGVCPECGAPANTWHLVRHYKKRAAARRARVSKVRKIAQTLLGATIVVLAAVPTMPFEWPFTLLQLVIVGGTVAIWWRRGRHGPDLEPGHCLSLLLIPSGVTCYFALMTLGGVLARWPVATLLSLLPGFAAAAIGLRLYPLRTVTIASAALAMTLLPLGGAWLNAGLNASAECSGYTNFERPWDLERRPTLLTTSESYTLAALTLPAGIVFAAVATGLYLHKARRARNSPPANPHATTDA